MLLQVFQDCVENWIGGICIFFVEVVVFKGLLVYVKPFYIVEVGAFFVELYNFHDIFYVAEGVFMFQEMFCKF
jgi:hypothetical protein